MVVGDRVLIRPEEPEDRTDQGLYLPPTVADNELVQVGRIIKVGPGYPVPNPNYSEDEPWAPNRAPARYIPLQAEEGDLAYFMRKEAIEISHGGERLVIVSQPSILMLVRDELHEEP